MPHTRWTVLLSLGLAALGAGCDAGLGLGIGSRCGAEKLEIRQRLGQPDRIEEGSRSEFWIYNAERITYEFSWDQNGENCSVQSRRFSRLPPEI